MSRQAPNAEVLTTNKPVQAGGLSGVLRVTELAPPSQPVSKPFVFLSLKVYHAPEDERNIAGCGGRERGERRSNLQLPSLFASPFPKCGLRSRTPPQAPRIPGWKERGAARGGRRAKTHSELCVFSPTCPGRGGAARPPSTPDPGLQLLRSSRAAGGPGPLSPPPQHVAGEVVPGQGLWVLTDYPCPVCTRPGQPLGPLGHPQPVPRGSGRTRLPSPGRQGALNWAQGRTGGCLECCGSLGKSPALPGSRRSNLGVGWGLGKFPLSSSRPIRHPLAAGSPHCPARPDPLLWAGRVVGPGLSCAFGEMSGPFLLPLRIRCPLSAARDVAARLCTPGPASAAAAALLSRWSEAWAPRSLEALEPGRRPLRARPAGRAEPLLPG